LVAVFDRLVDLGIVTDYDASPWSTPERSAARSRTVRVTEYALGPDDATVATLPFAVDYLRRRPGTPLVVAPATRLDAATWQLTVSTRPDGAPTGLARVPITDDA
jgi:hypothetical protein